METVLGLASLDLTYRSAVLAWLPTSQALALASQSALMPWAEPVGAQGADGVWLAEDATEADQAASSDQERAAALDQLGAVFDIVGGPQSWLHIRQASEPVSEPLSEATPATSGHLVVPADPTETDGPGPQAGAPVVVNLGVGDQNRSADEIKHQLWNLHRHAGPNRVLLLMPPPDDVIDPTTPADPASGDPGTPAPGSAAISTSPAAPASDDVTTSVSDEPGTPAVQVSEGLESSADDAAQAIARSVGVWTLAAAQGVRIVVANHVRPARRVVDTVAELLAGENGPVVVAPPTVDRK